MSGGAVRVNVRKRQKEWGLGKARVLDVTVVYMYESLEEPKAL